MNYENLYRDFIGSRSSLNRTKDKKDPGKFEYHHVVPQSLGGNNEIENLVLLTPREHYIAHWVLYKMYTGVNKAKMAYAFFMMCKNNSSQKRFLNSRDYERAKQAISSSCSGENHPSYGKCVFTEDQIEIIRVRQTGVTNSMFGEIPWNKGLTKDNSLILKEISEKQTNRYKTEVHPNTGVPKSEIAKLNMSLAMKNKPKSDLHKKALSKSLTGRKVSPEVAEKTASKLRGRLQEEKICPHCGKLGRGSAMYQWHFNNCKTKIINDA